MSDSLLDEYYYCPDCGQFHKIDTGEYVKVPGVKYVIDPDTLVTSRVGRKRVKVRRPKNGFGVS